MNKTIAVVVHLLHILHLFLKFKVGVSKSEVSIGYQMSLTVPSEYSQGFVGKALLMESDNDVKNPPPKYRTALSVEATDYRYACSLDLFLGSVKVWSSGHRSRFYASETCVLELTQHGDLRLKDSTDQIGWRTGTTGQRVQKLKLLETGNMVLVDAVESIKWQTFNFPTDVLVVGQRLSVATHLTSYVNWSSWFYSLEIQHDKLGLYLNAGNDRDKKYSYWEFEPSKGRNITFVELTSQGLELFDDALKEFAHIYAPPTTPTGVRFLALDNSTGNLGLYYYNSLRDEFQPSFEAIHNTCDLPLACSESNYTVCTNTGACSCIGVSGHKQGLQIKTDSGSDFDCGSGLNVLNCGDAEMVELEGVVSGLRSTWRTENVSRDECGGLCLRECQCVAVLYGREDGRECEFYDVLSGVKEKSSASKGGVGGTFLIKLSKQPNAGINKPGLRKWVLVVIVAADGLLLLFSVAGLVYFFLWKRGRTSS